MIKKFEHFENYEKLNEGWKTNLAELAIFLTYLFSSIGADTVKKYTPEYLERYAKTMNIANTNQIVQMVIKDFKEKIARDPKILNKQEVYKVIDETPIVYRKNDEISYILYNQARKEHPGLTPSCWCTTISKAGQKDKKGGKSIIFLVPNASYNDILHELSHAIETVVQIDPTILKMFKFDINADRQNLLYHLLTNNTYGMVKGLNMQQLNYLKNPSEVYSRLNNLKMFLYKHKFLNSPADEVSQDLLFKLISGQVYAALDEKSKVEFRNSDFMEILVLIDVKPFRNINQFVENAAKQKMNLA